MREAVWNLLQSGGTLLCANARAARSWGAEWNQRQQTAGRGAWERARIYPLPAWLQRQAAAPVLRAVQERWLWAEISGQSELAESAAAAWRLLQEWNLPASGFAWKESQATEAFQGWATAMRHTLQSEGWLTAAELGDAVAAGVRHLTPPAPFGLLGFDLLTPQQQALRRALSEAGSAVEELHPGAAPATPRLWTAADAQHELRDAAYWAMERQQDGPVAIIVPDLAARRAEVESTLEEIFHPARLPGGGEDPGYHLSLGPPLARQPLVESALQLLEWFIRPLRRAEQGYRLLRSPYLGAAERDREKRAQGEAALRRGQHEFLRAHDLAAAGLAFPQPDWREPRRYSEWAQAFSAALDEAGFPGDRALDSDERQTLEAWQDACSDFARLDQVADADADADTALRWLGRTAQRPFQPEAGAAPIQVMGWLEAAGLEFEHLWICGLHDGALPQPPDPNPLLPRAWQRERGMPRASAAAEAEFAARVLERLYRSSGEVVVSFPRQEGDAQLRPSPMLAGIQGLTAPPARPVPPPPAEMECLMECIEDARGPAVGAEERERLRGGSAIVRSQSVCAFQGFATHRLHARRLEPVPAGLPPTVRGQLLHEVLQDFWHEVQSQAALIALDEDATHAVLHRLAQAAVQKEDLLRDRPQLRQLEADRLVRQVNEWLTVERARTTAFTVAAVEEPRLYELAGLKLRLKLDRVDELGDGRRLLVDYKSGAASKGDWKPPRPWEPQLPLYLITEADPAACAGIAFAQLKPGDMSLKAAARAKKLIAHAEVPRDWGALITAWRDELTGLAADFMAGAAAVAPKLPRAKSCELCDLALVCRVAPEMPTDPVQGAPNAE